MIYLEAVKQDTQEWALTQNLTEARPPLSTSDSRKLMLAFLSAKLDCCNSLLIKNILMYYNSFRALLIGVMCSVLLFLSLHIILVNQYRVYTS